MVKVVKIPHNTYLSSFRTRDQIITKFGLPTTKKVDGEYEEIMYLYNVKTVVDKNANVNAQGSSNSNNNISSSSLATSIKNFADAIGSNQSRSSNTQSSSANANSRTVTQEVKSYLKFTLKGDAVINFGSNGVDFSVYEMVDKKELKKEKKDKDKN